MHTFIKHFTRNLNARTALAVLLGNVITGVGVAILRFSMMGNDPYTASTLAISGGLGIGLGNYQLLLNLVLLIIQLLFGRKYLGFGTVINMCFLGYIVQFVSFLLSSVFGSLEGRLMILKFLIMLVSLVVISFGLAMYQTADLGVAPYDYLALGMTEHLPTPFFVNRVITDGACVLLIVAAVVTGLIDWSGSNLGIGTIICAFGLGPVINLFMPWNKKWIKKENQNHR